MKERQMARGFMLAIFAMALACAAATIITAMDCDPGYVAVRGFWGQPVCIKGETQ
jgi:hypothetical protein